jgi:hypothetical protein
MANTTSETDTTIEGLLQRRAQFEQWLAKLDSAGDKAPPSVRQRVRTDYEARLRGVIEELRGHATTIAEELSRHQGVQSELDGHRRGAEEALAEAEIRHAVGEYGEDEWRRINEESQRRLSDLRSQLRTVGDEIARLSEVQRLITAQPKRGETPAPPTPSAAAPPAAAPVASATPRSEPERPAPRPQPEPTPVGAREAAGATRSAGAPSGMPPDEMTFLKSVSDEEQKPASRRMSHSGASATSPAASRQAEAATSSPAAPGAKTSAPGVAKTLKCGECGTLNRPTEWYCERCGAELAGV